MVQMKEWKSIDEQLGILQSRGMQISDSTKAKDILQRVGYYRLSGYSYPFRDKNSDDSLKDHFVSDTHLSDIFDLYVFDKRLRLLSLDALERIEVTMRVNVSYELGKLNRKAHIEPDCFNKGKRKDFNDWQRQYKRLKRRSEHRAFVKHNLRDYKELPIWVAAEIFDFGTLSRLFEIMRRPERDLIAIKHNIDGGNILEQWLKSLNYVRNVSAHHERLWNNNIMDHSSMPRDLNNVHLMNIAKTSQYRIFRYLCIMQYLLKTICPQSTWGVRLRDHLIGFPTPANNQIGLGQLGVVEGWQHWTLWDI